MNDGMGPLAGITVVDLTRALAGPYGTMIAGGGCGEGIKVERPGKSGESRGWGTPFVKGESP